MGPPDVPAEEATNIEPAWFDELLADRSGGVRRGGVLRFVESDAYAESFGKEWNWFSTTQLDLIEEGRTESREAFVQKTGFTGSDLEGRTVLDVGCGMGRFAEVAASHGARVVGVDLSAAVDAAHRNLAVFPDAVVLQADVFNLPFREESFDLIYSLGVLHHTPSTKDAFLALPRLLKPGGTIAIWVYSDERPTRYLSSDLLRHLTTRMDEERLLRLCRVAARLGRLYRTKLGRYLARILPVSTHPDPEWRVLDTFDWYAPTYQWKHGWEEVEEWFREAGLEDIRRHEFPVAVSGRRPA